MNVRLAIDDFGTGYSSLGYLKRLPVDKIKIDKSFTQGVVERAECAAVIASVLTLARALDITTTAEGIETNEQLERISADGTVSEAQGYLFSRPVPAVRGWPEHLRLAVNLSPVQFRRGDLYEGVVNALADSGLPAERLEIEITESSLLRNTQLTHDVLSQLSAIGERISADGTVSEAQGYLFSRPVPAVRIRQLLNASHGRRQGEEQIIDLTSRSIA